MKIIELIKTLEKVIESGVDENMEVIATVFSDDLAYSAFIGLAEVEELKNIESFEGMTPKQENLEKVLELT